MTAPAEHVGLSMPVRKAEVKANVGVGPSRVLTVQRGESGGVVDVELVGRVSTARRTAPSTSGTSGARAGRASGTAVGQPEVSQEALNHRRVLDQRDPPEAVPAKYFIGTSSGAASADPRAVRADYGPS